MHYLHNFFIEMLRSWSELLPLAKPSELKMFALIVANKTVGLYRSMLRTGWFVLICIFAAWYEQSVHVVPLITFIAYLLYILLLTRSSVPAKNNRYLGATQKTVVSLAIFALFFALQFLFFSSLTWAGFALPLIVLMIWTILDAHITFSDLLSAVGRAGKIFLYHCPFFIIVYLSSWYIFYPCITWPLQYTALPEQLGWFVACLILPWYSAASMYGYTRFVREHMDYYY